MKSLVIVIIVGLVLVGVFILGFKTINEITMKLTKQEEELPVRRAAVAGAFYPKDEDELKTMIRGFLDEVEIEKIETRNKKLETRDDANDANDLVSGEDKDKGQPRVLIVPHAGYIYSGQVAAYGYKMLDIANLHEFTTNNTNVVYVDGVDYKKVILIGPSHTGYLSGVSVEPRGYYETPLGRVKIDEELARRIMESDDVIKYVPEAHINEHDLEVQLPFLQTVLDDFMIVPILVSLDSSENVGALVRAIVDNANDEERRKEKGEREGTNDMNNTNVFLSEEDEQMRTLVVISSDLAHYPEYEVAKEVDNKIIQAILTKDVSELDRAIDEMMTKGYAGLDTCACGEAAIKVGMRLASELGLEGKLLKYANSGDVSGDYSRVVGYASIVFSRGRQREEETKKLETKKLEIRDVDLSEEDKQRLLLIARETLGEYLGDEEKRKEKGEKEGNTNVGSGTLPIDELLFSPALRKKLGAFVTLRRRETHELRGCIGRFSPTDVPLEQVVQEMAVAAATEDIRFKPVRREELGELLIEISVLSELKKIDDWRKIEVGKHGVEVVLGARRGVFLPQVATENNWDLETFMGELCEHKAGIAREAWKTGEAEIYVFTAEVFGEGGED